MTRVNNDCVRVELFEEEEQQQQSKNLGKLIYN